MGHQKERGPEQCRPDGKVILEVSRGSTTITSDLTIRVEHRFAEAFVSRLVIVREIQAVFNQRCARIGIVANTIATNPRIQQGNGQNEHKEQDALKAALPILKL